MGRLLILIFVVAIGWQIKKKFIGAEKTYGAYSGDSSIEAPDVNKNIILGNVKLFLKKRIIVGGHGFILNVGAQSYVTTASHLFTRGSGPFSDPADNIDYIEIVQNDDVLIPNALPAKGPSYHVCTMDNTRSDVVFFKSLNADTSQGLYLSPTPALVGQKVWIYCSQSRNIKNPILISAVVTKSSNQILKYKFNSPVGFPGTSGCPVLDSSSRVVGVNVCGSSTIGAAVTLDSINSSLQDIKP